MRNRQGLENSERQGIDNLENLDRIVMVSLKGPILQNLEEEEKGWHSEAGVGIKKLWGLER